MKKLFYDSAYIRTFEAKVLSCEKGKKGYEVALDQTAFYPDSNFFCNILHDVSFVIYFCSF